ncbi:hypothetical protein VNO77_34625 [Canavalia gladiata]|uniref:Uncharacterized protein n=1 Tax=Canavalia gladiata TaxID=3824 RepID=A0AAN9KGQ3_CANGL
MPLWSPFEGLRRASDHLVVLLGRIEDALYPAPGTGEGSRRLTHLPRDPGSPPRAPIVLVEIDNMSSSACDEVFEAKLVAPSKQNLRRTSLELSCRRSKTFREERERDPSNSLRREGIFLQISNPFNRLMLPSL